MSEQTKPDWKALLPILRETILENRLFMTDDEQQVALFIFQRTRMYGKAWERIPLRHFTGGVWSQGGGNSCSRLRMKRNTVIAALKSLHGKGFVERRDHATKAHEYRLCEPAEIIDHDVLSYIRTKQPKLMDAIILELRRNQRSLPPVFAKILEEHEPRKTKPAGVSGDTIDVSAKVPQPASGEIQPTNRRIRILKRKTPNFPPSGKRGRGLPIIPLKKAAESFRRQRLEQALVEARRWQARRRRHRASRLDLPEVQRRWEEAMQTHWPNGVIKLPKGAFRLFKLFVQSRGLPPEDLPELVEWIVSNWRRHRSKVFSFSGNPYGPSAPDLYFAVKRLPHLYRAFLHDRAALSSPMVPNTIAPHPPIRPLPVNHKEAEAARKRLGLPKWDEAPAA